MSEDNETLLRRLINGAASVLSGKTDERIQCVDCGEWKRRGDSSPCGSHPVLPEPEDDTFLIRIGFVKPKPALEEPPKVERLGRQSDERQVSNRFKDPTAIDPVREQPEQKEEEGPEPYWAEDPDFNPNAPAYHRGMKKKLGWGSSAEEIREAMDRAEWGRDSDDDDTPTTPRYGL